MRPLHVAFLVALGCGSAGTARAEAPGVGPGMAEPGMPQPGMTQIEELDASQLPPRCRPFAHAPASLVERDLIWGQVLSLGTCLVEPTLRPVTREDELQPMVEELSAGLAPALLVYVFAIEHGPESIQLRAVHQVGMAYVGLMTRARSSIAAPATCTPAAVAANRRLHDQLEPLLETARYGAVLTFTAIGVAVAENPQLAADPVSRYMVDNARTMLDALGAPDDDDEPVLARLAR